MAKQILLTTGELVKVSDEDFDHLNQWSWCPVKSTRTCYAGYSLKVNGQSVMVLMHRVICERMGFDLVNKEIDHQDYNGLNNQRTNLQVVTKAINQQRSRIRSDNSSGVKGINFCDLTQKWLARFQMRNSRISVGRFSTLLEAKEALEKAKELYRYGQTRVPSIIPRL